MTDKLRKYVLPNIPYVFIGWVFLNLGTAYRLAAGAGFGEKLLGLGQAVGAAFADFLNAVDYMFKGLEQRKPNCFAVKRYKKFKLSSGDICSK